MDPIFLDFESNKAGEIFLAGVQVGKDFKQIVLSEKLRGLAEFKRLDFTDPHSFINEVLSEAHRREASIAAYSTTEKDLILAHNDSVQFTYLNMKQVAQKWIKQSHFDKFQRLKTYRPKARNPQVKSRTWALCTVGEFAGLPPPPQYGRGRVTGWINDLSKALERSQGIYDRLTAVQKAKGTKLLKHNQYDIEAIALLYEIISRERPESLRQASSIHNAKSLGRRSEGNRKRSHKDRIGIRVHTEELRIDHETFPAIQAALAAIEENGGVWQANVTIALPEAADEEALLHRLRKASGSLSPKSQR